MAVLSVSMNAQLTKLDPQTVLRGYLADAPRAGGLVRCPAHDDRNPSMQVLEQEGRLIPVCLAGCDAVAIVAAAAAVAAAA